MDILKKDKVFMGLANDKNRAYDKMVRSDLDIITKKIVLGLLLKESQIKWKKRFDDPEWV